MKLLWLWGLLVVIVVACNGTPPASSGSLGPGIAGVTMVNGKRAYKLTSGAVVLPDSLEETQSYLDRYPPPSQAASAAFAPQALPASVDLSQYQTPVRSQGLRRTCSSFVAVAAIEAQYKRQYGLTLDLSEEWAVHVRHTLELWLDKQNQLLPPNRTETAVGPWGGGSVTSNLLLFSTPELGIPLEQDMPYVSDGNFSDTSMWIPPVISDSPQHLVSELNLSQEPRLWKIPGNFNHVMLPQPAIEKASYRANQVLYAAREQLTALDWYKGQLASGREVAFGAKLDSDDPNPQNDIWEIADEPRGDPKTHDAHAMLMVGYDDAKRAFRIKNSWDVSWGDQGYGWLSYDFVTKGKILDAAVVQSVLPPNFSQPPSRLFLGRYLLNHDGWRGVLDIYHFPGAFRNSSEPLYLSERRIGTYYGPDGQARRVNGTISGRKIDFYIDWSNTGARRFDELSGMRFTGFLADNNLTLAGTMLDNRDGKTYGFYGVKLRDYLSSTPGGSLGLSAYVGNWQIDGDVTAGSFAITVVNPSTGQVSGTVFGGDPLVGTVSTSDPRRFSFQLFGQNYEGYMFSWETGVMAGRVGDRGFIATRRDFSAPQVSIQSPQAGATLYRTQIYTLSGQARGDNGSGFIVDLPCRWTSSDSGDTQFPIQGNCNPTITLRPGSPSSVTFTLSATAQGGAGAQTSVTVNVQNPPNSGPPSVSIIEPASGSSASVGSTVLLGGRAVGGTPPYRNYRWTWQASKAGCTELDLSVRSVPSQPVGGGQYWEWNTSGAQNIPGGCGFDNASGTLRLYVTDDLSLTGSASIAFRLYYVPPPN